MSSNKLVFITLSILLFALTINAQSLSKTWEVQQYKLNVNLPQNYSADRDLDVTANLNLKNISSKSYSRLTLRISDKAEVSSVKVNNSTADFRKGEETIGGNRKLQRIIVSLASKAPNATFSVSLNYKLKVKDNTGLNALSPIGSQFLPMSFWYPTPTSWYFAGGGDFAPFSIQVNGLNQQQFITAGTKVGNGVDSKLNGQPFFVTGDWQKIDSNNVEVYAPKSVGTGNKRVAELANLASEAKTYVGSLLGTKNFPLKVVAVNRGAGFTDSGTFFIDDSVFKRKKLDAQTAMIIAEGVAKSWLGNTIRIEDNGYGVIREGLARFIATEFIEKKYGKAVADIERLRQRTSYSTIINRDSPLNRASPLDGYFYTANANKGSVIWRYLVKRVGQQDFYKIIQDQAKDGSLTLAELRSSFAVEKQYLDYNLDKVTEMNILVGLPQKTGGTTKVALRNMGEIPVMVGIVATLANGQKINTQATIPAKDYGAATFNNQGNIVRVEVDADKIYPQIKYSDDIAPREIDENDALVFIKRDFDQQKFNDAEKKAKIVLKIYPNFDDAQILLARSLLAQNKTTEATSVYQKVLNEKLPTSRSLAWASVGLGEIARKTGQSSQAINYYKDAIDSDAEYGATLAARRGRNQINQAGSISAEVKSFFSSFDKSVIANDKSKVESIILEGEISRFASSIAGQAQEWTTKILHTDKIDENNLLVETNLNIKLLNRSNEDGLAVFRLSKVNGVWKLSGVEIFEVR